MTKTTSEFEKVLSSTLRLSPMDKIRLLTRLASTLENELTEGETDAMDVQTNFRQAWHEAMTGKTHPIDKLWDRVDAQ